MTGYTSSTAGSELSADQRQAIFDSVKEELVEKELLSADQSIRFDNRFAVVDPGETGAIAGGLPRGEQLKFFGSLASARDFVLDNPGFGFVNGVTNGNDITIFAGATLPGLRAFGPPRFEKINFSAKGHARFVIFHELQHLNPGRGGTSSEAIANSRAFSLLRDNGFCANASNC